jgi:hypothetical protein
MNLNSRRVVMKNTAGTRVHKWKVFIEDRMIDHLDEVEYDATKHEFNKTEPMHVTENDIGRVWTF